MGQVTIEIPQDVNLSYQIDDSKFGEQLLQDLKDFKKKAKSKKSPVIIPPRRNSLKEDLENVTGTCADREESADEIARKIRDNNKGKTVKSNKNLKTIKLVLPYDDLDEIDENEAVGIWADREESANEIARRIRENNRRTT